MSRVIRQFKPTRTSRRPDKSRYINACLLPQRTMYIDPNYLEQPERGEEAYLADVPFYWLPLVPPLLDLLESEPVLSDNSPSVQLLRSQFDSIRSKLCFILSKLPLAGRSLNLWHKFERPIYNWRELFYPAHFHLAGTRLYCEVFYGDALGLAILCLAGKLEFDRSNSGEPRLSVSRKRPRSRESTTGSEETISVHSDTAEDIDEGPSKKTIVPSGERMPSALHTYYHTVVYRKQQNTRQHTRRAEERRALSELIQDLKQYWLKPRQKESRSQNFIACEHFYTNDTDVVRFAGRTTTFESGVLSIPAIPEPTDFIEPHVHVVWFKSSNNANYGIHGVIQRWKSKQHSEYTVSSTAVRCFHCISNYLHQGQGRSIRIQNISNRMEQRVCVNRIEGSLTDESSNIRCEDYRSEVCGTVAGKSNVLYTLYVVFAYKTLLLQKIMTEMYREMMEKEHPNETISTGEGLAPDQEKAASDSSKRFFNRGRRRLTNSKGYIPPSPGFGMYTSGRTTTR